MKCVVTSTSGLGIPFEGVSLLKESNNLLAQGGWCVTADTLVRYLKLNGMEWFGGFYNIFLCLILLTCLCYPALK